MSVKIAGMAAVILGWAALAPVAAAQESDAERLKKLEERVQKQQDEIDQLKKKPAGAEKPGAAPISGSLADGLRFKNEDGSVDIHVGGRFQEHFRDTFDRPHGAKTTPDTFFVRAARIKVDGTFYKDYGFQVELDVPSSVTGPSPTAQAVFVEWKRTKEFRIMAGQFKAPMSQERLRSRLFSDFVEDSMLTRFVPGYDIGIQMYGSIAEGVFGWQLAAINGRSHLDNGGRSRSDDNDTKEAVGRLTLSPWAPDRDSFLKGFRVGVSASTTKVDDVPVIQAGAVPALPANFDLITPELGITMLDPTGAAAVNMDGRRVRAGAELSYAIGPACLRAEYLFRRDGFVSGALDENVRTTAWSVAGTWILTGEDKMPENRITPAGVFLDGGPGAIELAARVAGARIGRNIQDVNVSLSGQANEVVAYTVGVNWWLTRNVRVSADLIREVFNEQINFGNNRFEDRVTGFLARFQIDF